MSLIKLNATLEINPFKNYEMSEEDDDDNDGHVCKYTGYAYKKWMDWSANDRHNKSKHSFGFGSPWLKKYFWLLQFQ